MQAGLLYLWLTGSGCRRKKNLQNKHFLLEWKLGDKEGKSHICRRRHKDKLMRSERESQNFFSPVTHTVSRQQGRAPQQHNYLLVLQRVIVLSPDNNLSVFIKLWIINPECVLCRKNIKASAICQYSFSDVQKVFDGPYMEVQDSKWREYTGKVPQPRPGSVSFSSGVLISGGKKLSREFVFFFCSGTWRWILVCFCWTLQKNIDFISFHSTPSSCC